MLQAVHAKERVRQASSVYCQWICVERPEGTRLVAIWIDSEMRAFTGEQEWPRNTEMQPGDVAEEADGKRAKGLPHRSEIGLDLRTHAV